MSAINSIFPFFQNSPEGIQRNKSSHNVEGHGNWCYFDKAWVYCGSLGMLNSHRLSAPSPWIPWLQLPEGDRRCKRWKQTSWFFFPLSEEEENVKQIKSCEHCLLVLALLFTSRCRRTGNTCFVRVTDVEGQLVQKQFLKNANKCEVRLWVLPKLSFSASYDPNN